MTRAAPWTPTEERAAAAVERKRRNASPFARREALIAAGASEADANVAFSELVTEAAWRCRGIDVAAWRCSCGLSYSTAYPAQQFDSVAREDKRTSPRCGYPRDACTCGRPYPRRCVSPGCARVVEPVVLKTAWDSLLDTPHRGGPLVDLPVTGLCVSCASDEPYKARAKTWAQSSVPAHERSEAVRDYWAGAPERKAVVDALEAWMANDLGRSIGKCALYLWGRPGRGKTITAAWVAHQASVERALVPSVVWTSQSQLRAWHDQRWQHDTERAKIIADQAKAHVDRVRYAPFLVVDELFSSAPRGAFAEQLADLIRDRLNERLPTLYTSNHEPAWSALLESDGRIDSRWSGAGQTVEVFGQDWRAST